MAKSQGRDPTFTHAEPAALEAKGTDKSYRRNSSPHPTFPLFNFFFFWEADFPRSTSDRSIPAHPNAAIPTHGNKTFLATQTSQNFANSIGTKAIEANKAPWKL